MANLLKLFLRDLDNFETKNDMKSFFKMLGHLCKKTILLYYNVSFIPSFRLLVYGILVTLVA